MRSRIVVAVVVGVLLFVGAFAMRGLLVAHPGTFGTNVTSAALPRNILLLGIDTRVKGGSKNTDVMIVAHLDPKQGRLYLMSVPRDTRVTIPAHGSQKINSAYAFGGPALAEQVVGQLLGTHIDYYAITNFDGFAQIIDTLGGVTVDVPQRMVYSASDVQINLQPGVQHLNGTQALELVRFRHFALGDIGRIQDQQLVLKAAFKQAFQFGTLLKLPVLLPQIQSAVHSNVPMPDVVAVGRALASHDQSRLVSATAPGAYLNLPGISYWLVLPQDARNAWQALLAGHPVSYWDTKAASAATAMGGQASVPTASAPTTAHG